MSNTSSEIFLKFFSQVKGGTYTLRNVSKAYSNNHLCRRDVAQVYQGIFLQSVVSFELLVEELFLNLIANKAFHPRTSLPTHIFPSIDIAKRIISQDRYIDWLPFDKAERMSKVFFKDGGNPFLCLSNSDKNELEKVLIIRNVIAHRSQYSIKIYERKVLGLTILPRRRRDILGYLQYQHTATVSKFEYHIGEIVSIARSLCN